MPNYCGLAAGWNQQVYNLQTRAGRQDGEIGSEKQLNNNFVFQLSLDKLAHGTLAVMIKNKLSQSFCAMHTAEERGEQKVIRSHNNTPPGDLPGFKVESSHQSRITN